jgi:hypothetical protein
VNVELVEHLEELPIKEEPIEENMKNPHRQLFPVIYVTKFLDSRVYHMCPDCGRQFPSIVCYAGNQIKHSDEKNLKEKKVTIPHEEACWSW